MNKLKLNVTPPPSKPDVISGFMQISTFELIILPRNDGPTKIDNLQK